MKLSVSILTYNHVNYIRQALDSVLDQETDFDFEVIVGDDCSTDGTRDIVKEYQSRFPQRIKLVLPERNLGDGGRPLFVETLRRCRGEFIAMVEGDDYWTSTDKLQRQVEYLESRPGYSMCYHNALVLRDGSDTEASHFLPPDHPAVVTVDDLLWSCSIPGCSPVVRSAVVSSFPSWYFETLWADLPLYLMAAQCGQIGYINAIIGVYRVHSGGIWSSLTSTEQTRGAVQVLQKLQRALPEQHQRAIRQCLAWQEFRLARDYAALGDRRKLAAAVIRSVWHDPWATKMGHYERFSLLYRALRR